MNRRSNENLIVLSTGRTGTKYLSQMFYALERKDISHQGQFSRTMNIIGNIGLCVLFESLSKKLLLYLLKKTDRMKSTADPLLSIPHILLVDKYNQNNKSKILHVVRDPRDFVTSFMNWKRQKLRRMFLHHCVPFWQPNPLCAGDVSLKTYFQMSKFEHFCWIWAFKNNLFEKRSLGYCSEYLRIKMEDLTDFKDPNNECINKLAIFLNIPTSKLAEILMNSHAINRSDTKYFPCWQYWTKAQALILDKHCGILMKKYGYGAEPEWQNLIKKQ